MRIAFLISKIYNIRKKETFVMNYMELIQKRGTLLAAHRGVAGGNIACNSAQAFEIALLQGADIVELDVERSEDGELFVLHPGKEPIHLRIKDSIKRLPAKVVKELYLSNCDLDPTDQHILTLEQALRQLKGRTIVNIDKFWENPEQIAHLVRKLDMTDEVLIKTSEKKDRFEAIEKYGYDLPYMAMVKDEDERYEERLAKLPKFVGCEILFDKESAPVASPEYINRLHSDGKFAFVNALVYDYRKILAAGHNDDISICGREQEGWGWLADRFDIVQTDFLLPCRLYLEKTGRRK